MLVRPSAVLTHAPAPLQARISVNPAKLEIMPNCSAPEVRSWNAHAVGWACAASSVRCFSNWRVDRAAGPPQHNSGAAGVILAALANGRRRCRRGDCLAPACLARPPPTTPAPPGGSSSMALTRRRSAMAGERFPAGVAFLHQYLGLPAGRSAHSTRTAILRRIAQ